MLCVANQTTFNKLIFGALLFTEIVCDRSSYIFRFLFTFFWLSFSSSNGPNFDHYFIAPKNDYNVKFK